jgi:hypothetical protein
LRTYTHLMPASEDRSRRAVDAMLGASDTSVTQDVEKRRQATATAEG